MPVNAAGAVAFFRKYFGPTQMAFGRLDEAGQAKFAEALEELWAGANVAENPADRTLVKNEYLEGCGSAAVASGQGCGSLEVAVAG